MNLSISTGGKRPSTISSIGKASKATMGPIKPMHEVFGSPKNKAKFAFPLSLASARSLEVTIKKENDDKEEKLMKGLKPQLNSK